MYAYTNILLPARSAAQTPERFYLGPTVFLRTMNDELLRFSFIRLLPAIRVAGWRIYPPGLGELNRVAAERYQG